MTQVTHEKQSPEVMEKETTYLDRYREYLPSQVNREAWSSRFVLFVENLSVSFDGFKAVDIPCYGIGHGELRVIIGPNGAGKTTFGSCCCIPASAGKKIRRRRNNPYGRVRNRSAGLGENFRPIVFDIRLLMKTVARPAKNRWKTICSE